MDDGVERKNVTAKPKGASSVRKKIASFEKA